MGIRMLLVLVASWGLTARADEPMPTRADFLREVFDAKPSALTPKFHDDEQGYHVVKEDLAKGLAEEAEKRKIDLRGTLIVGPMPSDPLWTYTVAVFLREGDAVRVNLVVFPHARITYKSTGLVTTERYEKWAAEMEASGVLEPRLPASARDEKDERKRDFKFTLLFAASGPGGKDRRMRYARPEELEDKARERFQDVLGGILESQETTYSVYKE